MVSRKSARKPVKKAAMPAKDECSCDNHLHLDKEMKQGYTVFGLLIAVLGLVWLANDIGWMSVGFSVGPVVVIILGLALIFTCIEARD